MGDRSVKLSTQFKVMQIAGSCCLEAITVTKDDELLMSKIIDGEIDGATYRREMARQFREANARRLSNAG